MFLRKSLILVVIVSIFFSSLMVHSNETKKESAIRKVGKAFMVSGPETAIRILKTMIKEKEKYQWDSFPFIGIINSLIYSNHVDHAIEMLNLLSHVFENPTEIYIALGEAYMMKLDKKRAKGYFKRVLKMNPKNFSAARLLRKIDQNILALNKMTVLEMKYQFEKSHRLKDSYLGQEPPGLTPCIFAPNLLSNEGSEVISLVTKDGNEIWFGVSLSHTLSSMMVTGEKNGTWTDPKEFSFSDNLKALTFTQTEDGKTIYFSAMTQDANGKKNHDIYYVEKTTTGWTKPESLGPPVNTDSHERHPFFRRGKLFFASNRPGSLGGLDIFYSEMNGKSFSVPKNMGPSINSSKWEWDISISPDETYLIIGSNRESSDPDSFDLFVSFKDTGGQWIRPKNMGSTINSENSDLGVVFSPDGKYIFYHSGRVLPRSEELGYGNGKADIYWVDAKIIEKLKPKELK